MAKNILTDERIKIINEYIKEKPANGTEWLTKKGYPSSALYNAVDGYAKDNQITTRGALDALKMGFITLNQIMPYWRVIGNKKLLENRIDELEERITKIEKGLGL